MTYTDVTRSLNRLSANAIVKYAFYWRHYLIFKKWFPKIGSPLNLEDAYQKHILAQLFSFLNGINRSNLNEVDLRAIQIKNTNQNRFTDSLIEPLVATPVRGPFELVPLIGFNHLTEALDANKGVILVSLHGTVQLNINFIIQHLAGIANIKVITYNSGKFGKYGQDPNTAEQHVFFASNAAVAANAQKEFKQATVLLFYNDTLETRSKNYMAPILGIQRPFKGGFAEMALLTGATIIPTASVIDEKGRIAKKFYPPLVSDKKAYEDKVLDLVQQYARFMETVWREHPETQTISKMKKMLRSNPTK